MSCFARRPPSGLRHYEVARECLQREVVTVDTAVGPVRFKVASRNGHVINASPESSRIASGSPLPPTGTVKDVQALAVEAYGSERRVSPAGLSASES